MSQTNQAQLIANLLLDIREEVIGLLFNRHVFRVHQEIVRHNPRLHGTARGLFCAWAQVVYAQANSVGVRRLASDSFEVGDINLVRFLNLLIREPLQLWDAFERHYPDAAARVRTEASTSAWQENACRRLLSEDRKTVIRIASQTNIFASKRVAHSVPHVEVGTTFSDLDEAIDALKEITEKYTLLVSSVERVRLEPLHRAGIPTVYPLVAELEKRNPDLLGEMKRRKLRDGWDVLD